ncbi:unnamed protein product, partial [Meganyctiphanes norvegica]
MRIILDQNILYLQQYTNLSSTTIIGWIMNSFTSKWENILIKESKALTIMKNSMPRKSATYLFAHIFAFWGQLKSTEINHYLASPIQSLADPRDQPDSYGWPRASNVSYLDLRPSIRFLKDADAELTKYRNLLNKEAEELYTTAKSTKSEQEKQKEESKETEQEKSEKSTEATVETTESVAATAAAAAADNNTLTQPQVEAALQAAAATNTFPVPYFAPDGGIQYAPMAGYGYGDAQTGQPLPTAQEVLGQLAQPGEPSKETYHSVPPSWELNTNLGSYGYGKCDEHRWHQEDGYKQYNEVLSKGYPQQLKDKKVEKINFDYSVKINPGPALNLNQPPPGLTNLPPPPMPPRSMLPLLPTPPLRGLPPTFSRPPPGVSVTSMAPPGTFNWAAPPLASQRFGQDYGKRRHPMDFDDVNPYKKVALDDQYRSEYNDNYTDSPGRSAPPSHTADFISRDYQHGQRRDSPLVVTERDSNQAPGTHRDNPGAMGDTGRQDTALSHDNRDTQRLQDLRNQTDYARIPRELGSDDKNSCMNVPDWLVQEGGELRLSETDVGVSVIRYWPHYMTDNGNMVMFRVLRKSLKWHQRRMNLNGDWVNQARLMSWIGPCEYNYCGMRLDKNQTWLPEIVDLLHRLIRYTENQYNSCFMNLLRNGYDFLNWQSEDHTALRDDPPIACLTFGEARMLEMRRKDGRGYLRFPLYPGSLLLMEGATQEDWQHQIAKMPNITGETIILSFRTMYMIEGVTV